jgi:hypothetical protein
MTEVEGGRAKQVNTRQGEISSSIVSGTARRAFGGARQAQE